MIDNFEMPHFRINLENSRKIHLIRLRTEKKYKSFEHMALRAKYILHMFLGHFKEGVHKLRNSSQTRLDPDRTIYSRATTVTGQVRSCINLVATARHQLIRSSINIFD